ncbi:MAG: hypothetical protein AABZ47_13070 [Planctomycetota bacterium]
MANTRTFDEVFDCTINGVQIIGTTSIETRQGRRTSIAADSDNTSGSNMIAAARQFVEGTINTTDALKIIDLINAAPGTATWKGRKSGTANWGQGTLTAPVIHGASFSANQDGFASFSANATCRFPASGSVIHDMEKWDETGIAAPIFAVPQRFWRPHTLLHGALAVGHLVSVGFSMQARLLTDSDGPDIGETVIDVGDWEISVNVTVRESAEKSGDVKYDIPTELCENAMNNLTVIFQPIATATPKTLTIRNVSFESKSKQGRRGWTDHTISGRSQFADPLTPFTLRTINDGTAVNRMINFA